MESPSPKVTPARKFKPIAVGKCHVQTATDRFGPGAEGAIRDRERLAQDMSHEGNEMPFLWPSGSGDEKDEDEQVDAASRSIYRSVPSMQSNRNTLTALSQLYNLYFVAYQGCIFVYRLRSGAKHALPRHPDLQLKPPASDQARAVGGVLDPSCGHAINHIITGHLGHEEIVLAAHDDGDVTAYKTKDVADYVLAAKQAAESTTPVKDSQSAPNHGKRPRPRQFFHENVGKSAWGLAIHQQSRLIAISSNRWEVTVFAFALYDGTSGQRPASASDERRDDVEAWVRQRQRTWRIVILLGREVDNLPNVCFLNDKEGNAEKVCAIDINGSIWIADIWKPLQPAYQIPPFDGQDIISDEFYPSVSRGWGVLAFTDNCYMEVKSVEELIGFPEHDCTIKPSRHSLAQPLARIQPVLETIPENPCRPSDTDRSVLRRALLEHLNHPVAEAMANAQENFLSVLVDGNGGEDEDDDVYDEDEDEDESEDEDEDEDEEDEDGDDGDDDFDDGNSGILGSEAVAAGPGGSMLTPTADVVSVIPLQEVFQDLEQLPGGPPGPPAMSLASHPPSGSAPPQHIMAQFQQQAWPFEATFQDLSDALGELEDAFGELEDALPHFGSAFSQLQVVWAQPNSVLKCPGHGCGCASENRIPEPSPLILDRLLQMVYYPDTGEVAPAPMDRSSRILFAKSSKMGYNINREPPNAAFERLAPGYRILRAYEKDFELWELPRRGAEPRKDIGMFCGNALEFQRFRDPLTSWSFRATSRLSLLAHVPELSIVVLGSPTGRVLVASLTRLSSKENDFKGRGTWRRGIRVEWVLPNKTEEKNHRTTMRALHGMAIGRIPDDGDQNGEQAGRGALLPRRYRLMLHYQNHDIFSYEVTRNEETGKICLF
ncbi:unnamed protein product [Clonostachys solani]|uniref:Uncharacterized protein n=1 Tax=Clonostachys solani TaxID=160281 RepID=A0A9N9Z621_9HYPO|nr:unnamed protein product [Clonostachys solani]